MDKELIEDIFQKYIVSVENYVGSLNESSASFVGFYFGQMEAFNYCLRASSCSVSHSVSTKPFGVVVKANLPFEKLQRIYRIAFDISGKVITEKIESKEEL